MGNELRGIISFDSTKLAGEQAKNYSEFSYEYDPAGGSGSNGLLDDITKINGEIAQAVEDIEKGFDSLKGLYDDFTDFEELVNSNTSKLDAITAEIKEDIEKIVAESVSQVNQAAANDAALASELESLGWNK